MHKKTDMTTNRPAAIEVKKGEGISTKTPPPDVRPTESGKAGVARPPMPPNEPLKKGG
jgi:hypothetical protein